MVLYMKLIKIHKTHRLADVELMDKINQLHASIQSKYHIEIEQQNNNIFYYHANASAELQYLENQIYIVIQLGYVLAPFKKHIESQLNFEIERLLLINEY